MVLLTRSSFYLITPENKWTAQIDVMDHDHDDEIHVSALFSEPLLA